MQTKTIELKRISRRNNCVIEVDVPSGPQGWQEFVNEIMKQELDKLRSAIEELGGQVKIRY